MGIFDIFKRKKTVAEVPVQQVVVVEVKPVVDVFAQLYPYQKEAVASTLTADKGIVCMPTGVGKTFCQAAIIADDIVRNPNQFRMYVVDAPRIILTYQLLKETFGFLTKYGVDARYMFVHSGGTTDAKELEDLRMKANADGANIPFAQIGSGTSPIAISEMILTAQRQNLPLIFFSTYNSAERIQNACDFLNENEDNAIPNISIVLNDEAHYLVQEQFFDILANLSSDRCYFFTATTIHTPSDAGRGMNNEECYGKVLYQMLPIDAILLGKMVRPRLHFVKTEGVYNTDDYNRSLNKIIADTFRQHEAILVKMKPKILVSAKGIQDIIDFLASPDYNELRNEGVDIFAVSSSDGVGNFINGVSTGISRQTFLKKLKACGADRSTKMIVLHYDILAEGIDVSGFTGIMPLRTLNKSKFLQTFGRSARPDTEDRKRIDSKEITVNDLGEMNKPFAYIMIPHIIHSNEDDKANITQLIAELRTFGFNPSEDILSSSRINGEITREDPESLNTPDTRHNNIGLLIQQLEAELEAYDLAQLSPTELLKRQFAKKL